MATTDIILSESDEDFALQDSDDSDFEFERENIAPISRKVKTSTKRSKVVTKKPSIKKKINSKPLKVLGERSINNENNQNKEEGISTKKSSTKEQKKTVEEIYQKKSQLEHILLRPDTYVGSVERITQEMYVFEGEEIVEKEITYTPGLYKIYDEILVNAADNKQRDENMDKLNIVINPEENVISVQNNGKGIPVVMHKEHKCYVPTLIFGHLLTGSNFDDEEKKTTGGRNGYGAKLANIFSEKFIVECVDTNNGLKFLQTFTENMTIAGKPEIKKLSAAQKKKGDYVKISFSPDLERFKMKTLDNDTVSLLSKRAYDIAGSMSSRPGKKLSVTLNGNKIASRNFQSYLKFYKNVEELAAYEKIGERWEVGVGVSDGSFQQISFVNAICTSKGGQHVTYIADQVAKSIVAAVNKKNKGGFAIKESQMKNHLHVFVNCLIDNPAFDSQTKETLTTRKNAFGTKCELSEKFLKRVEKSGVVAKILAFAKFKQTQDLQKKGGTKKKKLTGIAKLDDANHAGGAKGKDCTLILTEGDSAKSLAMSGLSVVGRDYYGVFPLKGKPLNVREATHDQIIKNQEIKNVVDIMGLKFGTIYDENNIKSLRYGHLMIMADQDHDGSHIKGLVINFIHNFWPSLLAVKGFLQQFITPIVKSTKAKQTKTFFTLPEYESWKESTGNDAKGWNIKYYKGLGTSTSAEAKDYFSHLDLHEITFEDITTDECKDSGDEMDVGEPMPDKVVSGSNLINMAFSKKHVEDRKQWLNNLKKGTYLNYSDAQKNGVTYSAFIKKELILFSQYDNHRSIPHLFDGLKPSQRKVLFACFLKNLKSEMKVAQLCGYVGEKAAYHHGEASLNGTIINMAQDFVGSNNLNLLTPAGQFGTRRMGGKDAASPRYVFTKLEKITRLIFHPDDDALLNYLNDDGQTIEPEFYMPVIPMALVNGSDGIGTGWSTNVPNFNPREIISNIRRLINEEELQLMQPFYSGFFGKIELSSKAAQSYNISGKIERTDDTTFHISELPIKKWTQDYKVFLEKMLNSDKNKEPEIKDFKENHTDSTVSFTISATKEKIDQFEKEKDGLYGKFKLNSTISTSNMNFFDTDGKIIKHDSPEQILNYFYPVRLQYYTKRKDHLLKILRREQKMLSNKARFIEEVCTGDLVVSNRKRKDILSDLQNRGYDLLPKENDKTIQDDSDDETEIDESEEEAKLVKGYEYLLGMKIWSLTFEKAEQLRRDLAEKTKAVTDLELTPSTEIWKNDLAAIEAAMDERDNAYAEAKEEELLAQNKSNQNQAGKKKKASRAKKSSKKVSSVDKDNLVMPKVKGNRKKKVQQEPKQVKKSDSDVEAIMEVDMMEKTSADSTPLQVDSDSDIECEGLPLYDRLRENLSISPSPNEFVEMDIDNERKRSSDSSNNEDDIFDIEEYKPATLTPAPKKKKIKVQDKSRRIQKQPLKKSIKNKRAIKEIVEENLQLSDQESSDGEDAVAITKQTSKKASKKTSKNKRLKKKVEVEDLLSSDDDFFDEDICQESVGNTPPPAPRSRSTRRKVVVKYAEDKDENDSESDSDFESDF